jgi:hypothetical protein
MNTKRYLWASLAVFVFIFLAEFLFHGVIMKNTYAMHMDLLRPEAEQQATFPFMILGFLLLAFGFCFIFVKGYEGRGIAEGVRFGLYAALAFGISTQLINYSVFPYPGSWVGMWIFGESLIVIAAGAIAAMIYRRAGQAA